VQLKAAPKHFDEIDPSSQFHQHFTREFFCLKVLCPAFLLLHFGFEIFGAKILAQKLRQLIFLMKSTPGTCNR